MNYLLRVARIIFRHDHFAGRQEPARHVNRRLEVAAGIAAQIDNQSLIARGDEFAQRTSKKIRRICGKTHELNYKYSIWPRISNKRRHSNYIPRNFNFFRFAPALSQYRECDDTSARAANSLNSIGYIHAAAILIINFQDLIPALNTSFFRGRSLKWRYNCKNLLLNRDLHAYSLEAAAHVIGKLFIFHGWQKECVRIIQG